MPLDRYGVLVGTVRRHYRDRPDTQGRWFHVNIEVSAPLGVHRCAVDVDSKQSATGVRWRAFTIAPGALGPPAHLAAGFHELARDRNSGALDYYRHPAFVEGEGSWVSGTNLDAARALEPLLTPGRRVLIFGEPFDEGLGVHNIHQNQGDPYGSQWWDENGIWQDGATLTERPDGGFDVFVSRFSTQSDRTDEEGHPVPSDLRPAGRSLPG
ncbi:DUF2278 family protein [Nonomuraea recticatena]|uniref:DUF2278 family protein n=1 Tax=Nonomuraea recticatena TaxID=46178 RepID=A0ABP6DR23_9ACTN